MGAIEGADDINRVADLIVEMHAKDAEIARLREAVELAALRAANAEQEKQIETLIAACSNARHDCGCVLSRAMLVPEDKDRLNETVGRCKEALSSLPPSDMRLVPVKLLCEIEWSNTIQSRDYCCPACSADKRDGHEPDCWLAAAIRAAEREKA